MSNGHNLKGVFDFFVDHVVHGWVFDPALPLKSLTVQVLIDGEVAAEGIADIYREDLHKLGAGDGRHAFELPLSKKWLRGKEVLFDVRTTDGVSLYQMPRRMTLPNLAFVPVDPPGIPPPVHLALCAIVRNEAPYLLEWIAWHHLLGVNRFVIFDNCSDDGTTQLLAALKHTGLVDHVIWPNIEGMGAQQPAYAAALARLQHRCRWVGFIDADEFFNPLQGETLPRILADFDTAAGLVVPWRIFGSNGHVKRSDDLVVSRFTRRGPADHRLNNYVKSIAQARLITRPNIHTPELHHGTLVDETGEPVGFDSVRDHHSVPTATRLVLNHYFCKSREEWEIKLHRGKASHYVGQEDWQRHDHEFAGHDLNDVEDLSLARFAPAIRAEVARLTKLMRGKPA